MPAFAGETFARSTLGLVLDVLLVILAVLLSLSVWSDVVGEGKYLGVNDGDFIVKSSLGVNGDALLAIGQRRLVQLSEYE